MALSSGTLQAWATVENIDLKQIGFLTLTGTAYTLKFLWAPLIDRYCPPFLGRRRGWILLMQLMLVLAIFCMGLLSPQNALFPIAVLATLIAFFSATQDIAFDAYRTDLLPATERGAGAATSVLGYRLAMLVSGGLALILADTWLGWQHTYQIMAGLMFIGVMFCFFAPEPTHAPQAPKTIRAAVIDPFVEFIRRPESVFLILLIVLYKLGDAFAGSLSTTFLIRGLGFDVAQVGSVNKVMGLLATIVGALLGGGLMARLGLFRSLLLFGILQAVSNLCFWVLAVSPKSLALMAAAVGIENLCGGMGTAAFVGLLMTICNKKFSATQFALLSALSALGRTYLAGPLSPILINDYGWANFFLITIAIALPGLVLLCLLKGKLLALEAQEQVAEKAN